MRCERCFPLLIFAALGIYAEASPTHRQPTSDDSWSVWWLLLFCTITVLLSGMYCGLTIGIMGLDTIYLEIIAKAGPEPDCSYASRILPVRLRGHQLLVTFLLGNMLTLVITSQLIAAIVRGSELVNFIVATVVVLIVGEIIPMSICSNGKYTLKLGSLSLPVVKLSMIVLYPVAKPLGMLLDCLISHDAGQIYDRNELSKLIHLYGEKYRDHTGMDADEERMMLSALDSAEVQVATITTPMSQVLMLEASTPVTPELQRDLWVLGRTRVPVFRVHRNHIVGVLYVKDLLGMPNNTKQSSQEVPTIESVLRAHPREVVVVPGTCRLQEVLHVFEQAKMHLLFVSQGSSSQGVGTKAEGRADLRSEDSEGLLALTSRAQATTIHSAMLLADECDLLGEELLGIITFEDAIERLINAQILDEDDVTTTRDSERDTYLGPSYASHSARREANPRVNLFSYAPHLCPTRCDGLSPYASSRPSSMLMEKQPIGPSGWVAMSEDQRWALAQYLSRSFVFFTPWSVQQIKFLIDHTEEQVAHGTETEAAELLSRLDATPTSTIDDPSLLLYRRGQPSSVFTFVLSGGVLLSMGNTRDRLTPELRSFSSLGEEVLIHGEAFVPDFTAVLSRTTRYLRISVEHLRNVEHQINLLRRRRHKQPQELTLFQPSTTSKCVSEERTSIHDEDLVDGTIHVV